MPPAATRKTRERGGEGGEVVGEAGVEPSGHRGGGVGPLATGKTGKGDCREALRFYLVAREAAVSTKDTRPIQSEPMVLRVALRQTISTC